MDSETGKHTRTLTLTTESNWCFVKDAPSMSFAEKDALKPAYNERGRE